MLVVAKNGPEVGHVGYPSKEPGLNTNIAGHLGQMVGTNAPVFYLTHRSRQ